ncbi:MAG: glucosaminidase domain-containing protein [Alphaproteobacteria bacterium]|nr:glucosaminidase domain-containing protein [Alphaproteobacteria bacterium]
MTEAAPSLLYRVWAPFLAVFGVIGLLLLGTGLWESAPSMDARLKIANAILDHARANQQVHGRQSQMPWPVPVDSGVEERKTLFLAKMLPLVAEENDRIRSERKSVIQGGRPHMIAELAEDYGLDANPPDMARLLRRVDTVPISLVLAQAAIESAWGTSRFAHEGHAYFGERTFDADAPGLEPRDAGGFKVKRFAEPKLSVRSYLRTLNTHPAYAELRKARERIRFEHRRDPTAEELLPYLTPYSEIRDNYADIVLATVRANDLGAFDPVTYQRN